MSDSFCKRYNRNGMWLFGAAAREARIKDAGGVDALIDMISKKVTKEVVEHFTNSSDVNANANAANDDTIPKLKKVK